MIRRRADRLSIAALAVSVIVAVMVGALGFPTLLAVNELSRENEARIAQEARLTDQLERLSLSNCTDLRDLTQGVYQLALTLKGLGEALESELQETDPNARIHIRLEEPEMVRCKPGQVVPGRP